VPGDLLRSGAFARKQIDCPNPVVAWCHRSRFRLAARLTRPLAPALGAMFNSQAWFVCRR
jgi:hypothetical protein